MRKRKKHESEFGERLRKCFISGIAKGREKDDESAYLWNNLI